MPPVFVTDFDPRHGELVDVSPLLRRIVCDNPSKFTFHGTGTYVIGRGDVAVVDPGPRDDRHIEALLRTLEGETVRHILITHTHGDHSPAATAVAEATGAPVLGFGPHPAGAVSEADDAAGTGDDDWDTGEERPEPTAEERAKAKEELEKHRPDVDFDPDHRLVHGEVVEGPGYTVTALHTPGHISNHLCFALAEEHAVLSGDHVMGWSTTIIPPPDGDIAAYLDSLRLMLGRTDEILYPTHGAPVTEPRAYVRALLDHRLDREAQIVAELRNGPRNARELVETLYADVRRELWRPAARSVIAHLRKLHAEDRAAPAVTGDRVLASTTTWELRG